MYGRHQRAIRRCTHSLIRSLHVFYEKFKSCEPQTYLGTHFSLPLCPRATVNHRVRCAWLAWSKISQVLTSQLLPMAIRRKLFEACISSTLLYGSECWALRASEKETLRTTQRKMERRMLGISLLDRWRNERIRDITKLKDWALEAEIRKMRFAMRIREMENGRWAKRLTTWIPYNRAAARTH